MGICITCGDTAKGLSGDFVIEGKSWQYFVP